MPGSWGQHRGGREGFPLAFGPLPFPARAAGNLLWLLLAAFSALGSGCFLPQDDDVLPFIPPARNRAPRLSLQTPTGTVPSGNQEPECPPLEFSALVEDDDVADRIYVQWFVDPNGNPRQLPYASQRLDPANAIRRPEKALLQIPTTGASPLANAGTHLVELLVSDGPLVNRETERRQIAGAPDGGFYDDTAYIAYHYWKVVVTNGAQDCPPP